MANKGRKPEWTLNVLDKDTDHKGKAGVAWTQQDGSIQIVLDPWVVLHGKGHKYNLVLSLFPYDPEGYKKRQEEKETKPKVDDLEDDVPF